MPAISVGAIRRRPASCDGCHATDDEHRGSRDPIAAAATPPASGKLRSTIISRRPALRCSVRTTRSIASPAIAVATTSSNCPRIALAVIVPMTCTLTDSAFSAPIATITITGSRTLNYDHAGRHQFALVGAHARITCDTCHTALIARRSWALTCADCHRSEDPTRRPAQGRLRCLSWQSSWRAGLAI